MQIGILRAIGVIVSSLSETVYSAIDLSETFFSLILEGYMPMAIPDIGAYEYLMGDPPTIRFRSWLENGSLIFTSTLRDSNGSL